MQKRRQKMNELAKKIACYEPDELNVNTIYNGDCLELMKKIPDESIDMILTDPPYAINFHSGYRKNKYDKIKNDDNLNWLDAFVDEAYRVAKNNTAHYIFCSQHNIDKFKIAFEKKFIFKNLLVWVKNNTGMGDLKRNFASRTEFILFLQKGRKLINGKRNDNVLYYKRTGNKLHPTEKPIDLLRHLIEKFSNVNDVVLDPFAGSGSTLVAAKEMKRRYIGIEIDSKYFVIAKKRLEAVKTKLYLF
jgi:site-specific DNA-methyltransferase (adenine-specific)